MDLHFRAAGPKEFPLIVSLLKEAAQKLQAKGIDQWSVWLNPNEEKLNWIQEGFANGEFYMIESEAQQTVGMFRLSYTDVMYWGENSDNAAYVHSLTVKPEFSGGNIGKTILGRIEEKLVKDGVQLFRLDCNAANAWLCSYYEQQGFVKTGEKRMLHSLNNLYEKQLL
jgi:ribosomal protein S18 acetylase RimI-like enzyme